MLQRLGAGCDAHPPVRSDTLCVVCRSPVLEPQTLAYAPNPRRTAPVQACRSCGFVHSPKQASSRYLNKKDLSKLPDAKRIGTPERKGREFYMAEMGVDILNRPDLDVLVYGAGRSFDNQHIEKLPRVSHVAIGDIMQLRDDAEFVDVNASGSRQFDVVIACEVVEHFRDPWPDFAKLFDQVRRDGLVVWCHRYPASEDSKEPRSAKRTSATVQSESLPQNRRNQQLIASPPATVSSSRR